MLDLCIQQPFHTKLGDTFHSNHFTYLRLKTNYSHSRSPHDSVLNPKCRKPQYTILFLLLYLALVLIVILVSFSAFSNNCNTSLHLVPAVNIYICKFSLYIVRKFSMLCLITPLQLSHLEPTLVNTRITFSYFFFLLP
jgi:hypothetical protein